MLLPNQIRDNEFTYSKGMYKAEEVDNFLEEVYSSYDRTFRENAELIKKMEVLAAKVEEYRQDEDSIRAALMAAQKTADKITKEAERNVEKLTAETQEKIDAQLDDAKEQTSELVEGAKAQAKSVLEQAQQQADAMIKAAKDEAAKIEADYQRNKKIEEVALEAMKKETTKFKKELLSLYNAHLALINEIPEIVLADIESQEAELHQAEQPEETSEEEAEAPVEEVSEIAEEPAVESEPEAEEVVEEPEAQPEEEFEEEPEEPQEVTDPQEVYKSFKKTSVEQQSLYDVEQQETEESETEQSDTEEIEKVDSEKSELPHPERSQSFEDAFAAFFSDDDDDDRNADLSDLDSLDEELAEDFDEDLDFFGDDEDDSDSKGFGKFFKKKK